MSSRARIAALAAVLLAAGCQSTPPGTDGAPRPPRPDRRHSVEITPGDDEFSAHRATAPAADGRLTPAGEDLTAGELYQLPKYTVTRTGFRKFGLSVVTNSEVALGGAIRWMVVGTVLPGSPADRQRLFTGLQILAIDGQTVTALNRPEMLHLLFEREAGEPLRLLVYSRHLGPLPRFVTLR